MPSSPIEEDIITISQKLTKLAKSSEFDNATALELIEALEKMPVNIEILTKTRIGMVLNDFRKNVKDDKVAKRCKSLIKRWKTLLEEKAATVSRSSTRSRSPEEKQEKKTSSTGVSSIQQKNGTTIGSSIGGGGGVTDVRSKSAEMLTNALRSSELPSGTLDPEELAKRIENRLFEFHRGTTDKYKAALRSRVFNLRDKKNHALRENVLTGAVSAEKFATMTTEEMASEEMKKTREAFTKESILEHQMSVQEGTPTDMFRCGKCGKNNCTYSQMQTRSADEPMTTFVFCRSCGNRWKFC